MIILAENGRHELMAFFVYYTKMQVEKRKKWRKSRETFQIYKSLTQIFKWVNE